MEAQNFWDDNDKAQKVIAESKTLKAWTNPYNELKRRFFDAKELLPEGLDVVKDVSALGRSPWMEG